MLRERTTPMHPKVHLKPLCFLTAPICPRDCVYSYFVCVWPKSHELAWLRLSAPSKSESLDLSLLIMCFRRFKSWSLHDIYLNWIDLTLLYKAELPNLWAHLVDRYNAATDSIKTQFIWNPSFRPFCRKWLWSWKGWSGRVYSVPL